MALGDLYQLTFKQRAFNIQLVNVFTYIQTNENTDPDMSSAEALNFAFQEDVVPFIAGVQTSDVDYIGIEVINCFDEAELFSTTTVVPDDGSVTPTDVLPLFMAWEFRTTRVRRDIRRGYKRFSGLDESMIFGGGPVAPYITGLLNLGVAMTANIQYVTEPLTPTFRPVIVGRVKYTTEEGNEAYRLPESAVEMGSKWFAADFDFVRVSTQNSRKNF